MATRTALLLAALAGTVVCSLPDNYQSLSAQEKQSILWNNINQNAYPPSSLPSDAPSIMTMLGGLTPSYLTKAFTHVGDEMIPGRSKIIHSYGTAAKATFKINAGSQYTGIFREGSYPAVVRSSLGAMTADNFVPGVAMKVLVDAKPSANFFALYSLDGQGENYNYFANSFVTTIPDPQKFALKALSKVFAFALRFLPGGPSERPDSENNSPLYSHAQINEAPETHIVAPYKVTFIPNPALGWDPADRTDFRNKLGEVQPGTKLWDVAARSTKDGQDEIIGEVVLDSNYVASPYQDETLYFQHPSRRWKP